MVLTNDSNGTNFLNFCRPSASITNSRGNDGSLGVVMLKTELSIVKNRPCSVVLLNISSQNRGLGVLSESQQGIRNATGRFPGIALISSTQRS